jgi:CrcB protein
VHTDPNGVAGVQLPAPATLRLVIDQHPLGDEERLDPAATVDDAGELQQLAEPDRLASDRDLFDSCRVLRGHLFRLANAMREHRHALGAIFLGGAAGGLLRVWLSRSFASGATDWPWAIFAINVTGSLALACIATWWKERPPESRFHHPLWTTGFCGAYTTFSTMQLEIFELLDRHRYVLAGGYAFTSIAAGYLAIWAGTALVRQRQAIV